MPGGGGHKSQQVAHSVRNFVGGLKKYSPNQNKNFTLANSRHSAFTLAEVLMANRESGNKCLHLVSRGNEPKEPTSNTKFKVAFTLAEVLITLAIIGVVAALTIPTLINNYQKQQYVVQLKKCYNTLLNGFKSIMARDGVIKITDTTLWTKFPNGYSNVQYTFDNSHKQEFLNELSKTFSIKSTSSPSTEYTYLNLAGSTSYSNGLILKDGVIIYNYTFYKIPDTTSYSGANSNVKSAQKVAQFNVDVNGIKGPNKWGRDLFAFYLFNDGSLQGYSGRFVRDFRGGYRDYYWTHPGASNYNCLDTNSYGLGCAGRVMEEGWQMNY